jgi:hypothetical protein
VYLGYHWLTDVDGSWLLAATVASIAMAFIAANQRPDWDTMLRDAVAPRDAFSRITSLVVGHPPTGRAPAARAETKAPRRIDLLGLRSAAPSRRDGLPGADADHELQDELTSL